MNNHINEIFNIFATQYKTILAQYKTIDKKWKEKSKEDIEDLISNVMLKIVNRIDKQGFQYKDENSYKYYIFISLRNEIYQLTNKPQHQELIIDAEDENGFDIVDDTKEAQEQIEREQKYTQLANDIEVILNENEDPINVGLFKYRFKYGYSIKKIHELTGYSISQIFYRTNNLKLKYQHFFKDYKKNYNKI